MIEVPRKRLRFIVRRRRSERYTRPRMMRIEIEKVVPLHAYKIV